MEELKKQLLKDVNASNLPLEAIYYVVKDLYRDVLETYNNMLSTIEQQKQVEVKEEEE